MCFYDVLKVLLPQPDAESDDEDSKVTVLITPNFMAAGMKGAINIASVERMIVAPDNDTEIHRGADGSVAVHVGRSKAVPKPRPKPKPQDMPR